MCSSRRCRSSSAAKAVSPVSATVPWSVMCRSLLTVRPFIESSACSTGRGSKTHRSPRHACRAADRRRTRARVRPMTRGDSQRSRCRRWSYVVTRAFLLCRTKSDSSGRGAKTYSRRWGLAVKTLIIRFRMDSWHHCDELPAHPGRASRRNTDHSHKPHLACLVDMRPSRITTIALAFCLEAQGLEAQQRDTSGPATLAAVERAIRQRAVADSFSGAVLVARHGEPLLRSGYGLADREKRLPINTDTRFNLGSIDKLITRIAVWQLVAAGKLQLDVPVGIYLPDYPNAAVRARVTARQLYNMSSGVGDFFNEEFRRRHADIRTVDDYLSLFAADTLQFEPGTARLYINGGYINLA